MKKLYWRPQYVSRTALVLVTLIALLALLAVEGLPVVRKQSDYRAKFAAARLARDGMLAIKRVKQRRNYLAPAAIDPAESGMIGESLTPVTSNTGYLVAKRTSANPNFAALMVHLLAEAELHEGQVVAVGVSGSFPALNLSTLAAIQTMKLRPIIISSTASSEWGANHVDYVWLDMERTLRDNSLIKFKSVAATFGGIDDCGVGLTDNGRSLLAQAMSRNNVPNLEPESLSDSIKKRMALYDELAGDSEIGAYINVGGGSASVGTHIGKKQFKPGLNRQAPRRPNQPDSVMLRFARRGTPVIHLSRIKLLAQRYHLPYPPTTMTPVGGGTIFINSEYNPWLALGGLFAIIFSMVALLKWNIATRLFGNRRRRNNPAPEPMV